MFPHFLSELDFPMWPIQRLTIVNPVTASYYLEQCSAVLNSSCHWACMVDCSFEGYAAGVGDESPCWFQANNTAFRGRESDRAALVCANCEVYSTRGNEAG